MTAADGYLDFTITSDYELVWCPACAKPAAIVCQVVITQQADPTNVVGRHAYTRCTDCEPFDDDEDIDIEIEIREDDMDQQDQQDQPATVGVPVAIREAADPKAGMTPREIGAWLQTVHREGVDLDAPVKVTSGWSQRIKRIEAKGAPS